MNNHMAATATIAMAKPLFVAERRFLVAGAFKPRTSIRAFLVAERRLQKLASLWQPWLRDVTLRNQEPWVETHGYRRRSPCDQGPSPRLWQPLKSLPDQRRLIIFEKWYKSWGNEVSRGRRTAFVYGWGMRRTPRQDQVLNAAIDEVRAVYAELEARPVERNCIARTECCQFKLTGKTPFLTKGEAVVAAKALRANGRKDMPKAIDGACPFLVRQTGKCMVYAGRPFGCRTHFCAAAGGPYDRREVLDLIRRLEKVDYDLRGEGPKPIEGIVLEALEEMG
jgi:Fe-S-cluster containining protein